jgi:hypothetical protein
LPRPFTSTELVGNHRIEQRDVLVDQLFLQRDRVRADDHALAVREDALDRRNEVGEALARAGAGLDHQAAAP